jgi:hypothetical protein
MYAPTSHPRMTGTIPVGVTIEDRVGNLLVDRWWSEAAQVFAAPAVVGTGGPASLPMNQQVSPW